MTRKDRQQSVYMWASIAFGNDAMRLPQRGIRQLEESIELYQACGCTSDMAHKLVDHIFSKPPGDINQEIGGVGVTLLALAEAADLDADAEEQREHDRVLSKPLGYWAARNKAKDDLGFKAQE